MCERRIILIRTGHEDYSPMKNSETSFYCDDFFLFSLYIARNRETLWSKANEFASCGQMEALLLF